MFRSLLRPVPVRRLSFPLPSRGRQPYTQRLGPVQVVYPRRQNSIRRTVVNCAVYGFAAFVWVQVVLSPLAGIDLEEGEDIGDVSDSAFKSKDGDEKSSDVTWIPLLPIPLLRKWDLSTLDGPGHESLVKLTSEREERIIKTIHNGVLLFGTLEPRIRDVIGRPRRTRLGRSASYGFHDPDCCTQPGFEIRNGEMKFVNRTLSPEEGTRLRRIWNPFVFFRAFYFAERLLLRFERADELRSASGRAGSEPLEATPSWFPDGGESDQSRVTTASGTIRTGMNGSKTSRRPSQAHDNGSSTQDGQEDTSQQNPGIRRKFSQIFLLALERERRAVYVPPSRSVVVTGDASIEGSICTTQVFFRAIYNPENDRFCEVQVESQAIPGLTKVFYDVPASIGTNPHR